MSEFIQVATTADLAECERILVEADDRLVILFRAGGQYYCLDDVCTHDGGTLSDGSYENGEIKCPRHGARFDIRTGEAMCMPATEPTAVHEVKVDGDAILVKIIE
ncbi:MAG: non-heme iron oxygenase ferredoxin subunit [Planctomycetota bacterium]